MKTPRITIKMLENAKACEDQRDLFAETFGDEGAPLTMAAYRQCEKVGLNFFWVERLLPAESLRVYEDARAESLRVYDAAMAEPLRVYDAARAESRRVYDAAITESWRVYRDAITESWRVYDAAMAEPLRVYEDARAKILLKLLRSQIGGQK